MSTLNPRLSRVGGVVPVGRSTGALRPVGWLRPEVLFPGCGLVLLPWSALLAVLPGGRPWVVLDLAESAALSVAAACLRRGRSPLWPAGLAGVLLVTDAGCDLATAVDGPGLLVALLMAACAELPLAAVCWSVAFRKGTVRTGGGPAPAAGRWPRLWMFQVSGVFRGRAVAPVPVGGPPTGFLTKGVSVQIIELTARSTAGIVSGSPASRLYAAMSSRLRVTPAAGVRGRPAAAATGRSAAPGGPAVSEVHRGHRPAGSTGRAPTAGAHARAEPRASRPGPGRTPRTASAAARAAAASSRRRPVLRRPAVERPTCFRELRSRKLRQGTAGPRRPSPTGG
ncbi:hypothetical protein [Kitasatospora sp. NPDC090308]|uniref:hypothetical protein n=1 Tax=Kitasatospora sp. NPDC090308 TaxID=3364082 RepID=UPI003821F0B3